MSALLDSVRGWLHNEVMPTTYLEVEEAAERLNVHRQRIYEFIKAGRLDAHKDDRGMWLISEESVRTFKKMPRGRPRKKNT